LENNSGWEIWEKNIYEWNAWENISEDDIKASTEDIASENEELTKTWPEHMLLIILAMFIWLIIIKFQWNRKNS
jgi:hypothetical protein